MKYIIALVLCALLSGCGTNVTQEEIQWGEKICKNNKGLAKIEAFDFAIPNATCNNGAYFRGIQSNYR